MFYTLYLRIQLITIKWLLQITLFLALWAVSAMAAPVEDLKPRADVPDQDAESQFLYSYGYGYPGAYAYAASALPAAYHVPVSTVGKFKTEEKNLLFFRCN